MRLLAVINIILIIVLFVKLNSQKKRINKLLRIDGIDVENVISKYFEKIEKLEAQNANQNIELEKINKHLNICISKVGLIRFNPYDDMGGDLCFALALLDDKNNGVVISTLHSREQSFTYSKEIKNLTSQHQITKEEQEAINKALKV